MERTVVVEKLSPKAIEKVVEVAIEQFAAVSKVDIPRSPFDPSKNQGMALVELESEEGVNNVLKHIREFMVLIGGMPRPVTARPASELYTSPPTKSKPQPTLVSPEDPRFGKLLKVKNLYLKHAQQRKVLEQMQRRQQESLESEHHKSIQWHYKMLQDCENAEGCLTQLRSLYSE